MMISPSKIASICNVSRWSSAYTCWHTMKGLLPSEPDKDEYRVGHAFEMALAELWKIEHPGWKLSPGEVQYVSHEFGFPSVVTLDRRACRGKARKIVELKTARDLYEWGDPNLDGDCPTDYALQVVAQMLLSGLHETANLSVMGPFFKHRTYDITFDEKVANWMLSVCRKFWASLDSDVAPDLDDSVSTYRCVKLLHPDITPGKAVDIPEALAQDYGTANVEARTADRTLRGIKTKILATVGDAQYVTCNGDTIAARQPHYRGGVSLVIKADPILMATG